MTPLGTHIRSVESRAPRARRTRSIDRIARMLRGSMLLGALWPSLVAAQPRSSSAAARAGARSCVAPNPIFAPARIDPHHLLYVEQETVTAQSDGRVLVAGRPVFLWARKGGKGRRYDLMEQDTLMGMIVAPPSSARALRSPIPGRSFVGVRSAALSDGWWLLTFAEVVPAPPGSIPHVVAMWAAETDGSSWRSLQPLPMIIDSMVPAEASALVVRDGRALLVVPSEKRFERRVVTYTRDSGQWSASVGSVGFLTYVALAATTSRDLLAVVRPDSTEREDNNSLFVYAKAPADTTWRLRSRLVRGYRSPVRDPVFSEDGDGLTLAWRVTSPEQRSRTAWFTRLNAQGDTIASNVRFSSEVELLYDAARGGNGLWVSSDRGNPSATLRFVEHHGTSTPSPERITPTTYRGLLGLTITKDYAVVIASQTGKAPGDPAVISIIQSHPWRCQ